MAYTPQTWVDNNASYPLSAARMNTIESGIQSAASVADQGHRILTTTQRDALTGVTAGTMIYNTTAQQMQIYIGTGWVPIGGSLVFTNEAARDAAITSPSEGMEAYLTAPTVPAATGSITAVPTGVKTIYNGSVWVCVTEIGARSETATTTTQTSYSTTLADGSTALSVTLVTGTSALVSLAFTVATNGYVMRMAAAVSGASTIAASDGKAILHQDLSNAAAVNGQHGTTFVFTGLTAGTNTFTAQYKMTGGTGSFNDGRSITVKGIA